MEERHVKYFIFDIERELGESEQINYIIHKNQVHIVHSLNEKMAQDIDFAAYVAWFLERLDERIGNDFYFYEDKEILEELNKENRDLEKLGTMLPE